MRRLRLNQYPLYDESLFFILRILGSDHLRILAGAINEYGHLVVLKLCDWHKANEIGPSLTVKNGRLWD